MSQLGQRRRSRRLWWIVGGIATASIVASFGTPKAGCAGSPDDEDDTPTSETQTNALEEEDDGPTGLEHTPPPRPGFTPVKLAAIASTTFCPTAGQVATVGARGLRVDTSGMRGVIADDTSRSVEIAFVFRGASKDAVPLANGEMRQQIGLKLRARDTCNVIYVMWHIAPDKGVHVAVKSNPGLATHAECLDHGYINLESKVSVAAPDIRTNDAHILRADLDGTSLRVHADGVEVWRGTLPDEAFAFDGPAGTRSDNGEFDFELRIPGGGKPSARCVNPGTESAH